ncbi:delayed-early response protein/equilibrative nucleoside transporter [Fulvimarina endophytica]|uniref:Nickel/cobalt efflux system n=1 Tax=Fulvimarina endophytica TaxID=2293836 RepID=A0A371X887_9HYPH|nr:nickel/cobalt transporter [Fulvimarina endophytica]RFC65411.1 delayed-early response protein/equilibrative nucleoside transporter [Fulvimarina endophytica]
MKILKVLCAACLLATIVSAEALARSSLGIGSAEVTAPVSDGPLSGLFTQIALWQREFFTSLRLALVGLKDGEGAFLYLTALSFAYGVFHAAGPGHGKAVISAYMLASRAELKRGVLLSFVSSFVQSISALVIVGIGWYLLRGSGVSMTEATDWFEIASYGMVVAVGLYLLLRALRRMGEPRAMRALRSRIAAPLRASSAPVHSLAFAGPGEADWRRETSGNLPSGAGSFGQGDGGFGRAQGFDRATVCEEDDCGCGRAHMPSPSQLSQPITLRSGIAAVFAVGLRPCSGAIVVLTFGLLNELYLGGILSVFAMGLGTAVTVSALATATVLGRGALERAGRRTRFASVLARVLEIAGACLLILLGLGLLGGVLFG